METQTENSNKPYTVALNNITKSLQYNLAAKQEDVTEINANIKLAKQCVLNAADQTQKLKLTALDDLQRLNYLLTDNP